MRRPSEDEIVAAVLGAYRAGAFPMADLPPSPPRRRAFTDPRRASRATASADAAVEDAPLPVAESLSWYSPDPRALLPLEEGGLHVPSGVARTIRKAGFRITSDAAFERVMRGCARPGRGRGGAWIDETMVRLYTLLHARGHAHSLEAWGADGTLLGGLYGVAIGRAFFAESMFSRLDLGGSGASSACLAALWHHLRARGYALLDVQIANEHTRRFGVVEIPRAEYLLRLAAAVDAPDAWGPIGDAGAGGPTSPGA